MSSGSYVCSVSNPSDKVRETSNKVTIKMNKNYNSVATVANDILISDMCVKNARKKLLLLHYYLKRIHLHACRSDVLHQELKMEVIVNSQAVIGVTRDLAEFLEILNQKQIKKEKRRQYKLKKKECKKQASTE